MQNKVKDISPLFNRAVIFNTDADSFHGHPEPLTTPPNITRKSIALYYYQALPISNESLESRHTLYVARPSDDEKTKAQVQKMQKKRDQRAKKRFGENTSLLKSIKQKLISWLQ